MYTLLKTKAQVQHAMHALLAHDTIAYDIESTGTDARHDTTLIVAIGTRDVQYAIDVRAVGEKLVYELMKPVLTQRRILIHNAAFDIGFMYRFGYTPKRVHCSMITEQILSAGKSFMVGADLASVAQRYLGVELSKDVRKEFINNPGITLEEKHFAYAATDIVHLFDITDKQIHEINKHKLIDVYNLEMAIIPAVVVMEQTGIECDTEQLRSFIPFLENLIKRADAAMQDIFIANGAANHILFTKDGYTAVSLSSKTPRKDKVSGETMPPKLLEALHALGIDLPSLGKKELLKWDIKNSSNTNTDDIDYAITDDNDVNAAIASYTGLKNPYLRALSFHTAAVKLLSAAVHGTLDKVNPDTGRVHFWFKQCGAKATGRFSSDGQQLPKNDKLSLLSVPFSIREQLKAGSGRSLLIADYSGIELFILADLSRDVRLQHECTVGDIHALVVRETGTRFIDIAADINDSNKKKGKFKLLRDAFKIVSYSVAYGTTKYNLSETLSINLAPLGVKVDHDGGEYILQRWKHGLFPEAGAFLNASSEQAVNMGYTCSVLGRKRWYDLEYAAKEKWALFRIMREASNHPIQATCADMMKLAMLYIWNNLDMRRARMVLTVHDELVIESVNSYVSEARHIMKTGMELAARQLLPIMGEHVIINPDISTKYDK